MVNHTEDRKDLSIRVPVTSEVRAQAQAFADQQPSPEKAAQVYRNTLAVLATNHYMQWQNYATDLKAGDSWSPTNQLCEDTADLMLVGLGQIECRPVLNLNEPIPLPPEVWYNRIGYLAVQLSADWREARLLGFVPPFDPEDPLEELPLNQLQSLDALIDYFTRLELGQSVLNEFLAETDLVQPIWEDPAARLLLMAQLERIYRSERPGKWRVKGEKVLSGRVLASTAVREEVTPTNRLQLQDAAEHLLERLAAVWRNSP